MPANFRPGAASIALAISTTAGVVVTPQRPAPQSISTRHSIVVPCLVAAADRSATLARSSTQQMVRAPSLGMRASRSILAGSRTWLETSTSLMPPRANTSASETFWQQTPIDPPSFSCSFCTSTDLCILPWLRWRMPWDLA